jgi:hypothetical protein
MQKLKGWQDQAGTGNCSGYFGLSATDGLTVARSRAA